LTYISMDKSLSVSWTSSVDLILPYFLVKLSVDISHMKFAVTSSLDFSWYVHSTDDVLALSQCISYVIYVLRSGTDLC